MRPMPFMVLHGAARPHTAFEDIRRPWKPLEAAKCFVRLFNAYMYLFMCTDGWCVLWQSSTSKVPSISFEQAQAYWIIASAFLGMITS